MKYKYLEYLRSCACLAVLVSHITGKHPYLEKHKSVILQSIGAWGTEAVIIFFILSGVVINHAVSSKPQSTPDFLKRRAVRIFPIYYFCLFFALLVDVLTHYPVSEMSTYIGSFLFVTTIQGALTTPLATIPSIWSLSFEMFFYVVFSFTIGKIQAKLLKYWFFLSLVCVVLFYFPINNVLLSYLIYMFSFSSLWLIGYFIYEYKDKFETSFSTSIFAFSLLPIINRLQISPYYYDILVYLATAIVCFPIFNFALKDRVSPAKQPNTKKIVIKTWHYLPIYCLAVSISILYSKSLFVTKIIYILIPLLTLSLSYSPFEEKVKQLLKKVEKPMLFISSISFALYLIHLPIIYLFGRLWPDSVTVGVVSIIILSFSISYLLEHYYQKRIAGVFLKNLISKNNPIK